VKFQTPNTPISKKRQRRITLTVGGAFHFCQDGIADGLIVFLPLWRSAFNLTLTQVGLLITCFEGATACCQIPAGFLGERFGERLLLTLGTLITALCFMSLGFAGGLGSLVSLLVAGGVGAAVQHPLASSMISKAYNEKGQRIALGSYNFTGDIGKFLFPALAAIMLSLVNWRSVCMGFGLSGCLLAVGLFFVLRQAKLAGTALPVKTREDRQRKKDWGIVNKGAFSTLSVIGMVDTAVRIGLVTFLPFLLILKGTHPESVGFALSLLFIGGAMGKFLCGVLAERIGIIATVVITESITGFGILLLTLLPLPGLHFFLPILGAALNGTSSVLYGTVAEFVSPQQVPRAFGLFYTFVIAAAAVAPPIMGTVSDLVGVGDSIKLIGGIALTTLPLSFILSRQMCHMNRGQVGTP